MPFRGFWDEKLHQPIFGTNNLTGTLAYYDNQPFQGQLTVKLTFNDGGVPAFLAVFNKVLGATRVQLNRERAMDGPKPESLNLDHIKNKANPRALSRMVTSYGTITY